MADLFAEMLRAEADFLKDLAVPCAILDSCKASSPSQLGHVLEAM
jgi:hypothetical protein